MRKLVFFFVGILFFCLPLIAQDFPKAELFGGYSYLRIDDGGLNEFQHEVTIGQNFHGWIGSITGNINKHFGIETEVSNYYGTLATANTLETFGNDFPFGGTGKLKGGLLAIMAGPRIAFRSDRIVPFVHALAGIGKFDMNLKVEDVTDPDLRPILDKTSVRFSDTGFALAIGGGLDVKAKKSLSIRIGQFDYLMTNVQGFAIGNEGSLESSTLNNFRIAFGLVFNLGGK